MGTKKRVIELIDLAIEETPFETKRKSMKKAKRYILNNWEGIENLFGEEKYRCSAEGHISHILSSGLSSGPMGWSVIGADEMARKKTNLNFKLSSCFDIIFALRCLKH